MSGYGVSPDELEEMKRILDAASNELGMEDFPERASLKNITTQDASPHENVEQTVKESVVKLTEFVDGAYAEAMSSMQELIARLHVTIESTAEGVSESGADYQTTDEEVAAWLDKHN